MEQLEKSGRSWESWELHQRDDLTSGGLSNYVAGD